MVLMKVALKELHKAEQRVAKRDSLWAVTMVELMGVLLVEEMAAMLVRSMAD